MKPDTSEFNPNNVIKCSPGTPMDAYFEGALSENDIQYYRIMTNKSGKYGSYDVDSYYFKDQDFEKATILYKSVKVSLINNTKYDPNEIIKSNNWAPKRDKLFIFTIVGFTIGFTLLIIIIFAWDDLVKLLSK